MDQRLCYWSIHPTMHNRERVEHRKHSRYPGSNPNGNTRSRLLEQLRCEALSVALLSEQGNGPGPWREGAAGTTATVILIGHRGAIALATSG
jgi:hypothetical protein